MVTAITGKGACAGHKPTSGLGERVTTVEDADGCGADTDGV